MKLYELIDKLQAFAHEGYALDEVEILDKDGNSIELLDDVKLSHDHETEIVQISAHHSK